MTENEKKLKLMQLLADHKKKLEEMVEEFQKTVDQIKKDAYKRAEEKDSANTDQAAEDLLEDL